MNRWSERDVPDQTGRTAIVTGANSGLGLEVARVLADRGASVILACRSMEKAEAAAADIRAGNPAALIRTSKLDLADLGSVADFSNDCLIRARPLHLLVNNAGVMGTDFRRTQDGFEEQLGVNHLGAFALTIRLLPALLEGTRSRIVGVSSMAHRRGRIDFEDPNYRRRRYGRWSAYGQSKLANLLFTLELQRRLATHQQGRATAVCAHPGFARSDLGSEGAGITNRLLGFVGPLVTQPTQAGALPILRAATDPTAKGGDFYGPRFLVRGDPVLERPAKAARDPATAARLWKVSAQLTNLDL